MKKPDFPTSLFSFAVLAISMLLIGGCGPVVQEPVAEPVAEVTAPAPVVAAHESVLEFLRTTGNLAAAYCRDQGHTYEIWTLEDGQQCGACVFVDGSACKAWDYFYDDCVPADNPPDADS